MISATFVIEPKAKDRPRFWLGRAVTSAKTRTFENEIRMMAGSMKPATPILGPLRVKLRFIMRAPKKLTRAEPTITPDLDNLAKSVQDSLNGIFWADDAQIVELQARKLYDLVNPTPRIEMTVEEIACGNSNAQTSSNRSHKKGSGSLPEQQDARRKGA